MKKNCVVFLYRRLPFELMALLLLLTIQKVKVLKKNQVSHFIL